MSESRADKKKVAAVAAVLSLLGAESPSAPPPPGRHAAGAVAGGGRPGLAPWALYGRQQIMSMRGLLQRRAFRR
jgi:hypothetical protein